MFLHAYLTKNNMMTRLRTIGISCFLLFSLSVGAGESEVTYLKPSMVHGLKKDIIHKLQSSNCSIPKWKHEVGGFTTGEFAASDQEDVAVVCRKDKEAEIRIFWGGAAQCENRIPTHGQIISTVGRKFILGHHKNNESVELPPIEHQAISAHFFNEDPVIYYCYKKHWVVIK